MMPIKLYVLMNELIKTLILQNDISGSAFFLPDILKILCRFTKAEEIFMNIIGKVLHIHLAGAPLLSFELYGTFLLLYTVLSSESAGLPSPFPASAFYRLLCCDLLSFCNSDSDGGKKLVLSKSPFHLKKLQG